MREKNRRLLRELRALRAWRKLAFGFGRTFRCYAATSNRVAVSVEFEDGRTVTGYAAGLDIDAAAQDALRQMGSE